MSYGLLLRICIVLQFSLFSLHNTFGQQIPIKTHSTNADGQIQLTVNSSNANYYVLKIRHDLNAGFEIPVSLVLGNPDSTIISESLGNYPLAHYQVLEYPINAPVDTDGDSLDDISEFLNFPAQNPINAAPSLAFNDGVVAVDSFELFQRLSITKDQVPWSEFLNGKGFVKYVITNFHSASPKIYFINSNVHDFHADFASAIGINILGDDVKKGQVIYHPRNVSNNGTLGVFAFNYSNGHGQEFDVVQRTHELLAANMTFLRNNLSYFVTTNSEDEYSRDSVLYQNSRVSILFEKDIYASIDYWGLNHAEGFGFFRKVDGNEVPSARDIVLYESLPNSLPRVGGIITSVIQTPLSHVNLRAIQSKVPNAFIREPLLVDSIADLLDNYIYFKTEQDKYIIRQASLAEVNAWFDDIRPSEALIPPLNLDYQSILPLDQISFSMHDGYGAKCTNIATMNTLPFPENTIPNGFGVPFYFYQEFMKYNGFFEELKLMLNSPNFKIDRDLRDDLLKDFRKKIKTADMPNWMLNALDSMHRTFPQGTSIRCRSSSNNEDLPGFNGAGLYDSKTQHPDEGHISKSIKQVFASLWNLRAFEEREFYKVDHFVSSMGVLCHPNYSDEKSNGVGVSVDPIYNTSGTFYLNSQVGEDLITNPDTLSIPEEIILDKDSSGLNDYIVVQRSNLIVGDSAIMNEFHLNQMRTFLLTIHQEFERLYDAVDNPSFAMDIEYKITSDNQLIIKQARPWVSYIPTPNQVKIVFNNSTLNLFPNPAKESITVACEDCNLSRLIITNIEGRQIHEIVLSPDADTYLNIPLFNTPPGVYVLSGFDGNNNLYDSQKFIKTP